MMDSLPIAEWTDESVPQLLELSRRTLGTGGAVAKTEAFWRWKHCQNPFGRSYGIYAMDEAAQRAAAMRVLLRWQFASSAGETLKAARAVDTATHPDYQRRGLFSQLTKQAMSDLSSDGTRLIFNTPNDKSLPGYLKMGWALVDKRAMYVRPLRPVRMLRRRIRPNALATSSSASDIFRPGAVSPFDVYMEQNGGTAWDLLHDWERKRDNRGWRTLRSKAYYAWRYGQHPHVTYYMHAHHEHDSVSGGPDGLAIVRPNARYGWQEVVLCEMALADPSVEAGRQLLRSLLRGLRADYVVAHFAPGTVEYRSLRRCGFLPAAGQGMRFTVRPLDSSLTGLTSPAAWDLSLGDLEIF